MTFYVFLLVCTVFDLQLKVSFKKQGLSSPCVPREITSREQAKFGQLLEIGEVLEILKSNLGKGKGMGQIVP